MNNQINTNKPRETINLLDKGKEVLQLLVKKGAREAYIIGRALLFDSIEEIISDIDIYSDLTSDEIYPLFNIEKISVSDELVSLEFEGVKFNFRPLSENYYTKDKNSGLAYSKKLYTTMMKQGLKVLTKAMNQHGTITDIFDSQKDIDEKVINTMEKAKVALKDNEALIRDILYVVAKTGFNVSKEIKDALKKYAKTFRRIKLLETYKQCFSGSHYMDFINLINSTGIYKYIEMGSAFKQLAGFDIAREISFDTFVTLYFVMQRDISSEMIQFVRNPEKVKKIYNLAVANRKCKYTDIELFSHGFDIVCEANVINACLRNAKIMISKIEKQYDKLPIKKVCDLIYKGENIMHDFPKLSDEAVSELVDDIKMMVLTRKLKNSYDDIENYVKRGINNYMLSGVYDSKVRNDNKDTRVVVQDYPVNETNERVFTILEKDKLIVEKPENDTLKDCAEITGEVVKLLKNMNYVRNSKQEKSTSDFLLLNVKNLIEKLREENDVENSGFKSW